MVSQAPGPRRNELEAIREWARASGRQVFDRGGISAAIQEAFSAAH